jgi:hypothetical protein
VSTKKAIAIEEKPPYGVPCTVTAVWCGYTGVGPTVRTLANEAS